MRRKPLVSCSFGPNQIAVDKHFEITSYARVLDFFDRDLVFEGALQLSFKLVRLRVVSSSTTILDMDEHSSIFRYCRNWKKKEFLFPNCINDGLNLCLSRRKPLVSCPFGPNQIVVDGDFEITSSAAVLDFSDREMAVEGVLQLLY